MRNSSKNGFSKATVMGLFLSVLFIAKAETTKSPSSEYFTDQAAGMVDLKQITADTDTVLARVESERGTIRKLVADSSNPAIAKREGIFNRLLKYVKRHRANRDAGAQLLAWQGAEELKMLLDYFKFEGKRASVRTGPVKIFSIRDFGAKGDGKTNDTPAFRRAFSAVLSNKGAAKLFISKGTYLIEPEKSLTGNITFTGYRFGPSAARRSPGAKVQNRAHLMLLNPSHLTIEGEEGSKLLFSDSTRMGLRIVGGDSVSVKNLILDYRDLCFTQGTVIALDKKAGTLDIKIDKGFPVPDNSQFMKAPIRRITPQVNGKYSSRTCRVLKYEKIGKRLYRLYPLKRVRGKNPWGILAPKSRASIIARYDFVKGAYTIGFRYSRFCTMENLLFHTSPGGAMRAPTCYAQNVINCRIRPFDSKHLVSTNADGFMGGGTPIGPYIRDCDFSGMEDDGINVNSRCFEITSIAPDGNAGKPSCERASGVFIIDLWTGKIVAVARVVNGHYKPALPSFLRTRENMKQKQLSLQEKVNKGVFSEAAAKYKLRPHRIIPLTAGTCGTVISNCKFTRIRGLGIQATSPNMLIENSSFKDLAANGVSIAALMSWNMGFSPHNVVVKGCRFDDMELGPGIWAICRPMDWKYQIKARPIGDLLIENNTFIYHPGAPKRLLEMQNCNNVIVRNNNFIMSKPDIKAIYLDNFSAVTLSNNHYTPSFTAGYSPIILGPDASRDQLKISE